VNSPSGKSFFYGYVIVAACFVVLYMLWGTVLNTLLTGESLGMKNFGAIYGLLTITVNLGGSLGPAAAGFFYDSQGTYFLVFFHPSAGGSRRFPIHKAGASKLWPS